MKKVLGIILEKLKGVEFAVIGTANMKLQGIEIEPKDIDLVTDDFGVEKIAKIFNCKVSESRGFKETDFNINDMEIHAASMTTNPLRNDNFRKPVWVKKWGLKIPCMPLESDLDFYQKANRSTDKEKIRLIREKLS